jgi:hypothetical protein
MPIVRLRDVAKTGIVTDQDPYSLPVGSFSDRRERQVQEQQDFICSGFQSREAAPRGTPIRATHSPQADPRATTICSWVTRMAASTTTNGIEEDYSPTWASRTAQAETNWTSYTIGNLVYVNRADRAPWYLLPDGRQIREELSAATYATPGRQMGQHLDC